MMKKMMIPTLFTLAALAVSLFFYSDLPESMAIHFGFSQNPDNWATRGIGAFLLPALILFIGFVIIVSFKFEKNGPNRERNEASLGSILTILSVTLFTVHCFIIAYNLGVIIPVAAFATLITGIVFILMGNVLPRLRQSSGKYPKLPEHIHTKAARFQGRLMFILGFVFLLLALLPNSYIFPVFFILLSAFIIAIFSSFFYYSRLD